MEAHYKSVIQKSSTERTKDRERDDALIERLRKISDHHRTGRDRGKVIATPCDKIDLTDIDRVLIDGESGPHLVGR